MWIGNASDSELDRLKADYVAKRNADALAAHDRRTRRVRTDNWSK